MYAGRKAIITYTVKPRCALHHAVTIRIHKDTQFTTATVIIAVSQPFKCLAAQQHCMVAQTHEIYKYQDFSTLQTLLPPSIIAHFRVRGKRVLPPPPTFQNTLLADNIFW